MTISKQKNGNALILAVAGRLDTITSPELEAALKDEFEGLGTLIFDFSALDSPSGRTRLWEAYGEGLFQQGRECLYRNLLTGEEFRGTIKGVTQEGRLLMADGKTFSFKEIGYII